MFITTLHYLWDTVFMQRRRRRRRKPAACYQKKINSVASAATPFKKERELLAPFLYLCHHRSAFLAELTEPWLFAHHLYDDHGQIFQLQCLSKTALELKNRHISWRICHRLMKMRCFILFLDSHSRAILGRH